MMKRLFLRETFLFSNHAPRQRNAKQGLSRALLHTSTRVFLAPLGCHLALCDSSPAQKTLERHDLVIAVARREEAGRSARILSSKGLSLPSLTLFV
jgi:hypothetical protein